MERPPLPNGCLLKQTYRIESLLAQGGASLVYLATYRQARWVIKEHFDASRIARDPDGVTLRPRPGQGQIVARIQRRSEEEIARARHLRHEGLVEMLDAFVENGTHYTVMPFYAGATLDIARNGCDLPDVVELLRPVIGAIEYLHARQLLHRDIKPENIWVTSRPGSASRALLLDTGQVRSTETGTNKNTSIFTPFGAPEYRGELEAKLYGPIAPSADVFALAGTIAYMCKRESWIGDFALRLLPERADPCQEFQLPRWPDASQVLRRALALKAPERHSSVASFIAELDGAIDRDRRRVQSGRSDDVQPPNPVKPHVMQTDRHGCSRFVMLLSIAACLVLCAVVVLAFAD